MNLLLSLIQNVGFLKCIDKVNVKLQYVNIGTELNQLLPPYSLDQVESDFEIDVSYLYIFFNYV